MLGQFTTITQYAHFVHARSVVEGVGAERERGREGLTRWLQNSSIRSHKSAANRERNRNAAEGGLGYEIESAALRALQLLCAPICKEGVSAVATSMAAGGEKNQDESERATKARNERLRKPE